jgi:aconitate hydratase
VFGTDSHTTMINGIGVLGWGVGGIEAEAAMLGQPSSMLIPRVVGFKLTGKLPGGTATDLVLTVTQMLRKLGVVGKFVEFYGDGLQHLPLADRATIGNMAPEYGATCGIFPIDEDAELPAPVRPQRRQINLVEAYAKAQGLWHSRAAHAVQPTLELDMGTVKPSLAGPKRPQDRVLLEDVQKNYREALVGMTANRDKRSDDDRLVRQRGGGAAVGNEQLAKGFADIEIDEPQGAAEGRGGHRRHHLVHQHLQPGGDDRRRPAGRNAAAKGLNRQPWVKTSLGPGSRVVTDYLEKAGVLKELEKIGFYVVGYGCTTCIGNSARCRPKSAPASPPGDLVVTSVLSGNRNFEGRVHPEVKMNYLASPPLVVAYAIAGTTDIDLTTEPLGTGSDGQPVFLRDIWPSNKEIGDVIAATIGPEMFSRTTPTYSGDARWNTIASPDGTCTSGSDASTYIKNPPYFDGAVARELRIDDVHGARWACSATRSPPTTSPRPGIIRTRRQAASRNRRRAAGRLQQLCGAAAQR